MNLMIEKFYKNNLPKRLLSAAILIPTAFYIFFSGGNLFNNTLIAVSVLMAFEWSHMIGSDNKKWQCIGVFYIVIPVISLIYLRGLENGFTLIMYLFILIWSTDTGAYALGIIIGGPKIAPTISPSKSWAGAIGGLLAAIIVSIVFVLFGFLPNKSYIMIAVIISISGQIGDLLESYFKRIFYIKDSGSLIPGHGGVLDRMDSIVLSAPILALLIKCNMIQ